MTIDPASLPSFDQLPVRQGAPPGSAWGVFGDDDELGTWNLVTPRKTAEAAALVRKGAVFSLNLALDAMPARPLFWFRGNPRHTIFDCSGGVRVSYDEYLDGFCPQSSSQWDGHRHVAHPAFGFYNGFKHEDVIRDGSATLGIQNLARRGIATRGVLLDIARFLERQGTPLDHTAPRPSMSPRSRPAARRRASRSARVTCCSSARAGSAGSSHSPRTHRSS